MRITSKESRLAAPSTGPAKERGADAKRGGAPGARPSFGTFAAFIQMNELGKLLFVTGLVLAAAGLILWSGLGRSWLGRLPGDIHVRGKNTVFYFPIVTCLLLSVVLSLILWLFGRR